MAKKKKSRSRPAFRWRNKIVTRWRNRGGGRKAKRHGRRRSSAGASVLGFKSGGSFGSRLSGSVAPVLTAVAAVVAGAIAGGMLAKYVKPKVSGSDVKTGMVVGGSAIALGLLAAKFGGKFPLLSKRVLGFAALGMAADGTLRALSTIRAKGAIPGLPPGDKAGLLAGAPPQGGMARRSASLAVLNN